MIVAEADNDSGGLSTYVQSGAFYGFAFYPLLLLLIPIQYYCQEVCSRIAIATNEGLISITKQKFGHLWAKIAMTNLYFTNFLILITEFAGINLISKAFNLNSAIVIPISILFLCLSVVPNSYYKWERLLVALCCFDFLWVIIALLTPHKNFYFNWNYIPKDIKHNYLMDALAVIGTTVCSWMLFGQYYLTLEKKLQPEDIKNQQKETLVGTFYTTLVAACMMLVGSFAFFNNIKFSDVPSFAITLTKYIGPIFGNLLFLMCLNASVMGTAAVGLSGIYAYCDDKNLPYGLNYKFKEAKSFYLQYFGSIILAGLIVLIPNFPLEKIIIAVQVISCVFLPYQLILNLMIANDKKIMNEQKNNLTDNSIMVSIIVSIIVLSIALVKQAIGF